MIPLEVKVKEGKVLFLKWSDQSESNIKIVNMRWNCPCAICVADKEQRGNKYIPIYNSIELKIKSIIPIGNYAIAIEWEDQHNTGIYDYAYLRQLSELSTHN
jgi:DUF971 family protein